eukprot:1160260-Pelagomonas_calceolata.AAC.4
MALAMGQACGQSEMAGEMRMKQQSGVWMNAAWCSDHLYCNISQSTTSCLEGTRAAGFVKVSSPSIIIIMRMPKMTATPAREGSTAHALLS